MKISALGKCYTNFKSTPQVLYSQSIHDYHDAISQWERTKSAKYFDVHDDSIQPENKSIRLQNYSFLDKITKSKDKLGFIQKFCEFTDFPNLEMMSKKIDSTFHNCISNIAKSINSEDDIIAYGYDPVCSVGLKKAFVGSDLDKGFVIVQNNTSLNDEEFVNRIKGKLWDNLDQRIVSLNHPDTFPAVYTVDQVIKGLNTLEKPSKNAAFPGFVNPVLILPDYLENVLTFKYLINSKTIDPYKAALFNRFVMKRVPENQRVEMKNFMFFIETVRDSIKYGIGSTRNIFNSTELCNKFVQDGSAFLKYSNVNQTNAWKKRTDEGYLKSKLRNRMQLEKDFPQMLIDAKYELIKDVIKASSNDQSKKFLQFFQNDDDIKARYDKLLTCLLRGKRYAD